MFFYIGEIIIILFFKIKKNFKSEGLSLILKIVQISKNILINFNNFGSQRKNGEKKLTEIIVIFQKKKNLLQGNILFFPGYRPILI